MIKNLPKYKYRLNFKTGCIPRDKQIDIDLNEIKRRAEFENVDFNEMVAIAITHEELHRVLYEFIDNKACRFFDYGLCYRGRKDKKLKQWLRKYYMW